MKKSIHSHEYSIVCKILLKMRLDAGITQQELANRLAREQSFVWRIENGERRLDLLEFFWVCEALEQDAKTVYRELVTAWQSENSQAVD
jgi:transcriptional regulator with XRE-family HTH domain